MAKRGNSEGSIYKRKDGRWVAALTLERGKRKYFYGTIRQEVHEKLAMALRDRQRGALMTGPSQTVSQYLNHWLEDVVRPSVRPRTHEVYALNVRRLTPHVGSFRLSRLDPSSIQSCYNALLKTGLSPRSVEQVHAVLHRALRQAVQWDLIARNPTEAVSVPRPKRREMQTLNAGQVQEFFAATRGDRLHDLWVLLVATGLRLGEATGLKWEDVDLVNGKLMVRRTLQRQRGVGPVFVEPKSERSRRTVHLCNGTLAILGDHRHQQVAQRLLAGPLWDDQDLVFCTEMGKPLDPASLRRTFHRALDNAGLPKIRIHDLRHTAATLLLAQGVHPKVVQELLGHSTITLTLDTYSHAVPALHVEASAQMDSLFEGLGTRF